ncbi:MAG: CBS domain-containing protein [Polyangiaceae bacterium]|nr:CBS domain-containing protein [Polyangiaceae bacterium]
MSPTPNAPLPARLLQRARDLNAALLRLMNRATPTEQQRLFLLTLVVGGICGLVAVSFHLSISWCSKALIERAMALSGWKWVLATIAVPVLGATIVGFVASRLPNTRGSGIPQVKAIYTISTGRQRLRLRDAVAKFFLASLMIGSGSSLGREGPTVQICATVASGVGRIFALSPSNQRRLIPVGAAAGIAAAFNAPIAAVTFVIEELVGALDTTVLSGVVVAAALAAVVEHSVLGEHTVFTVPHEYGLAHSSSLIVFALLGIAAGLSSAGFTRCLLSLRKSFSSDTRIPAAFKPAMGALVTGCLAVVVVDVFRTRGVTGGGYDTIGRALGGDLALDVMVVLFVAKSIATIFGYSSGGVGGIFAPTLFIGSMLGGAFGHLEVLALGHETSQIGAMALVGMGAFFAGVIRAPITSVLIIFEMTGNYRLVLPLMISNTAAYLVARRLRRDSIYEALLEQDGIHLPHGGGPRHTLTALSTRDAMTRDVLVLSTELTVRQALERIAQTTYSSFPVVTTDGALAGVITEGRLRRVAAEGEDGSPLGAQARMREYLHTEQTLRDALSAMNRLGVRQMVVVEQTDRSRVAGILSMSDVMRAALAAEPPPDSRATSTPISVLPR